MRFDELIEKPRPWKGLFLSSFIGLIFLIVNFPKFLSSVITTKIENPELQTALLFPIASVRDILSSLVGASPEHIFRVLMTYNFVMLWVFLTLVVVFAIRHLDFALVAFGFGGIVLGYSALHLISWIAIIIVTVIVLVAKVTFWIGFLITLILQFIIVKGWWLLLLLALAGLIYYFRKQLLKVIGAILGTTVVAYLLHRFVPIVWHWFLGLINPIIQFTRMIWEKYIGPILAVIFTLLIIVFLLLSSLIATFLVLATLGSFVIDQLKAAWYSGSGRKGLALAGFAIGSGIALVILTSVAAPAVANGVNDGWIRSFKIIDGLAGTSIANIAGYEPTNLFVMTMPISVEEFVFKYLRNVQPPIVDGALFLGIISLATLSLMARMPLSMAKVSTKVPVSFLPKEYLAIVGGLLIAVVLIFLQAFSEGDT
jgi:hypothetical protein